MARYDVRILSGIKALLEDATPIYCLRLSGRNLYRLRPGRYKIVYEMLDSDIVVVFKIWYRVLQICDR
jgi:mRNA-degrading endonuclease RelE of RelBE toxin-antitoxin system